MKVLIITASNTWGLFLLVLLLGYGLVEVPRGLWQASNWPMRLAQTHFKLAKMSMEKQEASDELEDILEVSIMHFKCNKLPLAHRQISWENPPLIKMTNIIA